MGERLQVEYDNGPGHAATDETAAQFPRNGDTMNALAGNLAQNCAAVEIEHYHFTVVRNIQPPAFAIGRQIIPAIISWYRDFFNETIFARSPRCSREHDE